MIRFTFSVPLDPTCEDKLAKALSDKHFLEEKLHDSQSQLSKVFAELNELRAIVGEVGIAGSNKAQNQWSRYDIFGRSPELVN